MMCVDAPVGHTGMSGIVGPVAGMVRIYTNRRKQVQAPIQIPQVAPGCAGHTMMADATSRGASSLMFVRCAEGLCGGKA